MTSSLKKQHNITDTFVYFLFFKMVMPDFQGYLAVASNKLRYNIEGTHAVVVDIVNSKLIIITGVLAMTIPSIGSCVSMTRLHNIMKCVLPILRQ